MKIDLFNYFKIFFSVNWISLFHWDELGKFHNNLQSQSHFTASPLKARSEFFHASRLKRDIFPSTLQPWELIHSLFASSLSHVTLLKKRSSRDGVTCVLAEQTRSHKKLIEKNCSGVVLCTINIKFSLLLGAIYYILIYCGIKVVKEKEGCNVEEWNILLINTE